MFTLLILNFFLQGITKPVIYLEESQYRKIIQTPTFVDKSMLIKQIFNNDFVFITAPGRFGKSTNMDMVKTFVEIIVDENGNPVTSIEDIATGELDGNLEEKFTDNCKLFKQHNLKIYHLTQFFHQHCGQYPVIHVDFKSVTGKNFDQMLRIFRTVLGKTLKQHWYLLKSIKLNLREKNKFKLLYDNSCKHLTKKEAPIIKLSEIENITCSLFYKKPYKHLTQTEVQAGLHFLAQLLNKHFNKTVFVLIDNLDVPVFKDIFNPYSEILKTVNFINKIMLNIFNNSHVERGLINSRIQLPLDINIKHFLFLHNHNFAEFYGLTNNEVENLLYKFNISDKLEEIKKWYNGYKVTGKDIQIYNFWSIINYLKFGVLKSYWPYSDDIKYLKDLLLYKKVNLNIHKLLNKEVIAIQTTDKTINKNIQNLKKFVNFPVTCINNKDIANSFIMFLYDNGYFNIVDNQNKIIHLEIPNLEISKQLSIYYYSVPYYINNFNFDYDQINLFIQALNVLYVNKFTFKNFVKSVTDLYFKYNVSLPENEIEFHSTLLAFVQDYKDFRVVDDLCVTHHQKNLDIVIVRKDGSVIILGLKFNKGSAYEALEEIINKYYETLQNVLLHNGLVINNKFYIGLYLDKMRKVNISYLINSRNIKEATNLTSC